MALFDGLKEIVHDTAANMFGERVSWTPSVGGETHSHQCLFNRPDKDDALGSLHPSEWQFTAADTWFEYRDSQFPLLKEAVRIKRTEYVYIYRHNGDLIAIYEVRQVKRMWDGDTYRARLEEVGP